MLQSIYPNLDKQMADHNIDYTQLAREIGLGNLAMYRRLKGIVNWSLPEALAVCQFFDNANATELFTIR